MTFGLVHGAWHGAWCWDLLVPELEARGHAAIVPELPCDDPGAGFEEYAAVVTAALESVQYPVVVGHSLGSDTIPLVAIRRPVHLLVYLCPRLGGFTRPDGEPEAFRKGILEPMRKDELGRTYWEPDDAVRFMYPRLSRPRAEAAAARLRRQANTRLAPYPVPDPPSVPTALLYTAAVEFFDPEWSRWVARAVLGVRPIELPGGHFPMLERPTELAQALSDLLEDGGASGRY